MAVPSTFYDLFQVDYDATREEIYQAYQRMVLEHAGNPDILRLLKDGWVVLGSERSRAEYDERNEIEYLRIARQQLRRPPPTLVEPIGRAAPNTIVMPEAGHGAPRTMVMPEVGQGTPRTVVMPGVDQAAPRTIVPDQAELAALQDIDLTAPPTPSISVSIMVQSPSGKPWSRSLPPGDYIVGRKSTAAAAINDIPLEDPDRFMSRRHAALVVKPDGCFVRDEHSANGTYVNGHLIPPGRMASLANGDRIGIEGYVLIIDIQTVA